MLERHRTQSSRWFDACRELEEITDTKLKPDPEVRVKYRCAGRLLTATVSLDSHLERLARYVAEVAERYGADRDLGAVRWTVRGGRAWLHTVDEWPLEGWESGRWRPISIGFRAIDFDSRGRPRPTNDLLRWLADDVGRRVIDVSRGTLDGLLRREAMPCEVDDRGPIALRFEGDVIGRGAVTVDGLKSEIPKSRASDFLRILSQGDAG